VAWGDYFFTGKKRESFFATRKKWLRHESPSASSLLTQRTSALRAATESRALMRSVRFAHIRECTRRINIVCIVLYCIVCIVCIVCVLHRLHRLCIASFASFASFVYCIVCIVCVLHRLYRLCIVSFVLKKLSQYIYSNVKRLYR
jgi:hypothetical protein